MSIKPFKELNIPSFIASNDSFYSTGSNGSIGEDGAFDIPLSNKVQINLSFPVKEKTQMLGNSSSIYYFNVKNGRWNIPSMASDEIKGPFDKLAFQTNDVPSLVSGSGYFHTSGGSLYLEDKLGFDPYGLPVSSGSASIRGLTKDQRRRQSLPQFFRSSKDGSGTDSGWQKATLNFRTVTALKKDGSVWSWGENEYFQIGNDNISSQEINPTQEFLRKFNWRDVANGPYHVVALDHSGSIYTWGWNGRVTNIYNSLISEGGGQLGIGVAYKHRSRPTKVSFPSSVQIVSASAGKMHSVVIDSTGGMWACGSNRYYESAGTAGVDNVNFVQLPGSNWEKVACGNHHSIAKKTTGDIWQWGRLRESPISTISSPTKISGDGDGSWKSVFAGQFCAFAIKNDGSLYAWGTNDWGQLGTGNRVTTTSSGRAKVTASGGDNWLKISSGYRHTLGLRNDGTLWSWGSNLFGELGLGVYTSTILNYLSGSTVPFQIGDDTDWSDISAGYYCSFATKRNGSLWVWGYNEKGVFGPNNTTGSIPHPLEIGTGVLSLSSGEKTDLLTQDCEKSSQRNESYFANADETFNLSLDKPFLIEKVVVKLPMCFGSGWFYDKTLTTLTTSSYAGYKYNGASYGDSASNTAGQRGSFYDDGGPALSVALFAQKKYQAGHIRDLITHKIITHTDDTTGQELILESRGFGTEQYPRTGNLLVAGIHGPHAYNCHVISPTVNGPIKTHTGSLSLELTPHITNAIKLIWTVPVKAGDATDNAIELNDLLKNPVFSPQIKGGNLYANGIDVFGRGMTGQLSPSGGSIFGGEFVTTAQDLVTNNPFYIKDEADRDSKVVWYNSQTSSIKNVEAVSTVTIGANKNSPYLLQPGENLLLSITKSRPAIKNYSSNIIGEIECNVTTYAAGFDYPVGLAFDSSGSLFITENSENSIKKITSSGTITTFASGVPLSSPAGIVIDSSDNIYVANYGDSSIVKITSQGAMSTIWTNANGMGKIYDVALSPSEDTLYITSRDGGSPSKNVILSGSLNNISDGVGIIAAAAAAADYINNEILPNPVPGSTFEKANVARFNDPTSLSTDDEGNIYVADFFNHAIRRIKIRDANNWEKNWVTTYASVTGSATSGYVDGDNWSCRFNRPRFVKWDKYSGNLFITDYDNHSIRMITPNGNVSTIAGPKPPTVNFGFIDGNRHNARFKYPQGIAFFTGSIYVADTGNNAIRKITMSTDNISLGVANMISSSYAMSIPNSTGHDVQLNTGSIDITIYGSYVGAGGSILP